MCNDYPTEGYGAEEMPAEPSQLAEAMMDFGNKLMDGAITYGFNPEVVDAWMMNSADNWMALGREQDIVNA